MCHFCTLTQSCTPSKLLKKENMLCNIFLFTVSFCSNICQIDVLFQICGIWRHYTDLWLVLTFLRLGNCDGKYLSPQYGPVERHLFGETQWSQHAWSQTCVTDRWAFEEDPEVGIYKRPLWGLLEKKILLDMLNGWMCLPALCSKSEFIVLKKHADDNQITVSIR